MSILDCIQRPEELQDLCRRLNIAVPFAMGLLEFLWLAGDLAGLTNQQDVVRN